MRLGDIIYKDEYTTENEISIETQVAELTRDFEKISESSLFFLLKSIKNYSESIINIIKERKPLAIISEKAFIDEDIPAPILYVRNVRQTMATAYSRFFKIDYQKSKFIAVTGTNGKTTTATLIKEVLLKEGESVGFIGTGKIEINGNAVNKEFYSMTTPDPEILYPEIRAMQNAGCKYIVMEASSHALFYDKLAPIPFEIGIFTNLSAEHLDFHKNLDAYYEAKFKLFENCKAGIFNRDDKYSRKAFSAVKCAAYSIGILWPADVMAREINQKGFLGTEYIYRENALIFKVKMNLIGGYNIYNSMLAIKTLILLGLKPCRIKKALSEISSIDGRFEITNSQPLIIRDYAHTPEALDNLLKTVKSAKNPKQNMIIVFGCGGERDKQKRPLMAKTASKYCDFSIVTSDNSRSEPLSEIIEDILKGFRETEKRTVITDRKKAIEYAILTADKNDVVIIAGKGAENYIIDANGTAPFSEKDIIKDALLIREKREVHDANCFRDTTIV